MSKVWRRLQRVGKKASKFRFSTYSHRLVIDSNTKWQPDKVCITWSHRDRKISSRFGQWEPGFADVYKGTVQWEKTSDMIEFDVTLYRGINDGEFEEKEWILMVESEDANGKRKLLATGRLNIENYASMDPQNEQLIKNFKLKIISSKIKAINLDFSISSLFIKDGKATRECLMVCQYSHDLNLYLLFLMNLSDEDMISVASYMSIASNSNFNTNSNRSSDRHLERKSLSSNLNELDKSKSENVSNTSIKFNEASCFEEEMEDPDKIDYYLKLKLKQNDVKFESISENFNSFSLTDTTLTKNNDKITLDKDDFQENFLKMIDTNNQNKQNESKVNSFNNKENQSIPIVVPTSQAKITALNTNKKTLKCIETLPNLVSKPKAPTIESKNKSLEEKTQNKAQVLEEKNPFLETEKNPFLDLDNNETIINQNVTDTNYNPFLEANTCELDTQVVISSPPQLESTVKSFPKDNTYHENFNASNTTKDLMEWCRDIIKKSKSYSPLFKNLTIKDFSSSWVNGLAFCAIIYHFKPNLIDLKQLSDTDSKVNLKIAFRASDSESVVRVIDVGDIINKKNPDQLSIMTYLYNICDKFEPKTSKKFSKKNVKSKTLLPNIENKDKNKKGQPAPVLLPDKILTKEKQQSKPKSNYFNPFDEDDDDGNDMKKLSPSVVPISGLIQIKSNGEIVDVNQNDISTSLHDQKVTNSVRLVQRRNSLNNSSSSSSSSLNSSTTVKKVNEHGSNLNSVNPNPVPNYKELKSEDLIQKAKELIEKNKKAIHSPNDEVSVKLDSEAIKKETIKQRAKAMIAESKKSVRRNTDTMSNKDQVNLERENNQPLNENGKSQEILIGTEYVNQEIINLKNKQKELDEQGNELETQLRFLMKSNNDGKKTDADKELEDILLKKWFLLVNQKNALLHQQQELEILQNEKNLEKRHEILTNQLRNLMQIEDYKKTEEQKKTETILFNELISLVNKRNDLVTQLDEENKLINEGEILNDFIQNKKSFQGEKDNACIIQ